MSVSSRQDYYSKRKSKQFYARQQQEVKGSPLWDVIYHNIWDNIRVESRSGDAMDRMLGVDKTVVHKEGYYVKALQEKSLSDKYSGFNSLTVEYMNDPSKDVRGDWFNSKADVYSCGYLNEDMTALNNHVIVDWQIIKQETRKGNINWIMQNNQAKGEHASFMYVDMLYLPPHGVVAYCHDGSYEEGMRRLEENWFNRITRLVDQGIVPYPESIPREDGTIINLSNKNDIMELYERQQRLNYSDKEKYIPKSHLWFFNMKVNKNKCYGCGTEKTGDVCRVCHP